MTSLLLADTPAQRVAGCLLGNGLEIDLGAARVRVRSDLGELVPMLRTVYGNFAFEDQPRFSDVTAKLRRARGIRRWLRPQVQLVVDGAIEFEPYPRDTPLPLLEWGLNYALASRLTCHLLLHAGAVERDGRAVLLPAMPGAGKSTLTAALTTRGFRLLSDEFGVVRFGDAHLLPLLRPVALKNESIDVIARFAPTVTIGPRFPKTHKGTVAHMAPAAAHVAARHVPARPALVVFPRFEAGGSVEIEPMPKARAFARLAVNSFNYEFLGPDGFEALGRIVHSCATYHMRYGDLQRGIAKIEELLEQAEVLQPS